MPQVLCFVAVWLASIVPWIEKGIMIFSTNQIFAVKQTEDTHG